MFSNFHFRTAKITNKKTRAKKNRSCCCCFLLFSSYRRMEFNSHFSCIKVQIEWNGRENKTRSRMIQISLHQPIYLQTYDSFGATSNSRYLVELLFCVFGVVYEYLMSKVYHISHDVAIQLFLPRMS